MFVPICAFNMYAVGYEVYHHPPFLLIGLHNTGYKCNFKKVLFSRGPFGQVGRVNTFN
jgi:hypothetical protein